MQDWRRIITEHHERVHVQPGDKLLICDGASIADVDHLQQTLGFELPNELRSLYQQCDGFGLTYEDDDQKWWFCHPLDQIPDFVNQTRKWFEETHPDLAVRFFPFIDWSNGDGMGYVLDENGEIHDGLYCFEHESYEFEKDQKIEEFVVKWSNTIYELLTYVRPIDSDSDGGAGLGAVDCKEVSQAVAGIGNGFRNVHGSDH